MYVYVCVCVCVHLLQAERWDSRKCIIPLLHTLMYAIIQVEYSCYTVELFILFDIFIETH